MTTETRERFLRAIGERLSAERVAEVHLFPPLRQGGTQSAVAVIAVRRAPAEPPAGAADAGFGEPPVETEGRDPGGGGAGGVPSA